MSRDSLKRLIQPKLSRFTFSFFLSFSFFYPFSFFSSSFQCFNLISFLSMFVRVDYLSQKLSSSGKSEDEKQQLKVHMESLEKDIEAIKYDFPYVFAVGPRFSG